MTLRTSAIRAALLASAAALTLTACGGTKVYDTSKTIVYNGSIYQVTDVKQISTKVEGRVNGQMVNLKNKDKGEISDLIEDNEPMYVRMAFQLDEQELVYAATDVDSYRDYNRLASRFEDAGDDIAKLMSREKTDQLELK